MRFTSHTSGFRSWTLLALAAAAALSSSVFADTELQTWTGNTSTNWNDGSNWSPNNNIPNNGNAGISDYDVYIATPVSGYEPVLTSSVTIDTLQVNSDNTLTINPGITLNINGPTVDNEGTITIDTLSSSATLNFLANTTISGAGTISLNDYNPNARITAAANVTVTVGSNQTINGVGEIDAPLINNGNVRASVSGHTLYLQTSNMTNNNLFDATSGGTLNISGITVNQSATGFIGNDGAVSISNATINGGEISGTGVVDVSSSTFSNLTVTVYATVLVTSGSTLNYGGPGLMNNGVIQISNVASASILNFTSNTTITGSGSIFLDTYNPDAEITAAPGVTVTNDQTIHGVGDIDAPLINNAFVNADISDRVLLLQTSNMTNNANFEATNNGTLTISGITVTQSASGYIANVLGTVNINGNATISGGWLLESGLFNVSNATFSNLTIAAGATVLLASSTVLNYAGATFTNNGFIQIDNFGGNADLNFTGNTTLTGTGAVYLDDSGPNARLTTSTGATLTNNQTIYGLGEIDAALINNGTLIANATNGSHTLVLQTNDKTNNGLIEATNNATLAVSGITITQGANGMIENAGGTVNISNATIAGGSISGGVTTITANSTFSNISIASNATVFIQPGIVLNIAGPALVNNGLIQIDNYGSNADLNFTGNTTISGNGSIYLDDNNPYALLTSAANATVTIGANSTVYGLGEINAAFINQGNIIANATNGNHYLVLNGPANNANLIRATGGGVLQITADAPLPDGSLGNGTIEIDANSTITFTGLTSVTNAGTISLTDPTASFTGLNSLTNAGIILLAANTTLTLPGTLTGTNLATLSGNGTLVAATLAGKLVIQGGTVRLASKTGNPPASQLTSLTLAGSSNAWTTDLDLTNNKLIVEDAITHATTLATLENEAFYGRSHATGITSSDLSAHTVLAVVDNATLTTPLSTFGGMPVDNNSILIAPELLGDTNIDGAVDLNDLNIVLNHLGTTNSNWTAGNFDGAATIDLNDLNDVLNNLGVTYANASTGLRTAEGQPTPTPEPASIFIIAGAILPAFLPRRRKMLR